MNNTGAHDTFRTVGADVSAEITVKGSRFIAHALPAGNQAEAAASLESLKAAYHGATHYCYGCITGCAPDRTERFSDGGEPAGTAGRQVLEALRRHDLTNVMCVVIRYFGGPKLGIGGLSRAYADAAHAALEKSDIVIRILTDTVKIGFPYDLTGAVEHHIERYGAAVGKREFAETPVITCAVRKSRVRDFLREFRNITGDKGSITPL